MPNKLLCWSFFKLQGFGQAEQKVPPILCLVLNKDVLRIVRRAFVILLLLLHAIQNIDTNTYK